MFVMGKANAEEIKRMKDMGWDVEEVHIPFFNKCLDPLNAGEVKECEDGDKMVSIFVDMDMVKLFQEWADKAEFN